MYQKSPSLVGHTSNPVRGADGVIKCVFSPCRLAAAPATTLNLHGQIKTIDFKSDRDMSTDLLAIRISAGLACLASFHDSNQHQLPVLGSTKLFAEIKYSITEGIMASHYISPRFAGAWCTS